jgi:O-antigen/teichoic acid export membrane protein
MGDFGAYRQFFVMELTILTIFQLGVNQALFYFIPRDEENAGAYFFNSLALNIILYLPAIALVRGFAAPLADLFKMPLLLDAFWLLALDTLTLLLAAAVDCYLLARDRVRAQAVLEIVTRGGTSLATLAAALLRPELEFILLVLVVSRAAGLVLQAAYVHFGLRGFRAKRYFFNVWEQVRHGIVLGVGGSLSGLQARIQSLVVSSLYGPEVFAVYSAGITEIPLVTYFAGAVATVSLSRFVVLLKEDRREEARQLWREILATMYAVTLPAIVVFVAVARPLIELMFTAEYADAAPIFVVNTFTTLAVLWNATLVLRAIGRNDVTFWVNVGMIALGTPLMVLAARSGSLIPVVGVHVVILLAGRVVATAIMNRLTGLALPYAVSPQEVGQVYRSWLARVLRQLHTNRGAN